MSHRGVIERPGRLLAHFLARLQHHTKIGGWMAAGKRGHERERRLKS